MTARGDVEDAGDGLTRILLLLLVLDVLAFIGLALGGAAAATTPTSASTAAVA
ncbi:MAG: hypothetical protein R2700_04955 [Solirubrobacterales bacterium]